MPLQMDFLEHSAVEDVIIMGVVLEEACCNMPFLQLVPCAVLAYCLCVKSLRTYSLSSMMMIFCGVCALHAKRPGQIACHVLRRASSAMAACTCR